MGRTVCTEPECLCKGALELLPYLYLSRVHRCHLVNDTGRGEGRDQIRPWVLGSLQRGQVRRGWGSIWFLFLEKKLEGQLPSPRTPEVTPTEVYPNNIRRTV